MKTGDTFTTYEFRKKFLAGIPAKKISNSISYLKTKGILENSNRDEFGNVIYKVIKLDDKFNGAFTRKPTGKSTKHLIAYKEAMKARPLIDVLISIEHQMKSINTRLSDALAQASSSTTPESLKTFTIQELLSEVSKRTAQ